MSDTVTCKLEGEVRAYDCMYVRARVGTSSRENERTLEMGSDVVEWVVPDTALRVWGRNYTGGCHVARVVASVRHDAGRLSTSGGHHAIPRRKLL